MWEVWKALGTATPTVASHTCAVAVFCFFQFSLQFVTAAPSRRERPDTEWRLYSMSTLLLLSIAGFTGLTAATVTADSSLDAARYAHALYFFSIPSAPFFFEILCAIFLPNVGYTYAYPRRRREAMREPTNAALGPTSSPARWPLGGVARAFVVWLQTYFLLTAVRSLWHVIGNWRRKRVHVLRAICQIAGDVLVIYAEIVFLYIILVAVFRSTGLDHITGMFEDRGRIPGLFEPISRGDASNARYYPEGRFLLVTWGVLSGIVFVIIAVAAFLSARSAQRLRPRVAHTFFGLAALVHTAGGLAQGAIGYNGPLGFPFGAYTSILLIIALVALSVSEINRMSADVEGTSLAQVMAASTGHTIGNLVQGVQGGTEFYRKMIFEDLPTDFREKRWPKAFLEYLAGRVDADQTALNAIRNVAARLHAMRIGLIHGERTDVHKELKKLCQEVPQAECDAPHFPPGVRAVYLDWPTAIFQQVILSLVENAQRSIREKWPELRNGKIIVRLEYNPGALHDPIVVRVTDNGRGIDPAVARDLGRRPPARNSTRGFGLFFVRKMVERIGGHVEFSSEPQQSFSATLHFPGDRVQADYERAGNGK
jgi:signal transduction histidine kinase